MPTTMLVAALTLCVAQEARFERGPIPPMPDIREPAPLDEPVDVLATRPVVDRPAVPAVSETESIRHGLDQPRSRALGADLLPQVQFDVDGEGRHWARGADYKASFGPEGASFIPFLGSDAPRNFPLRFSVAEIGQGGAPAPLTTPSVARAGDRILLDQGAVRSEYVPGLAGLEQLFVLDEPLGEGELVLDVAVESELVARPDGAAWRYEHELGAVSYGAAFVLDAEGRRLDLETLATGAGLRFVVPADYMAVAAWPIAIDPLLVNVTIDTGAIDQLEVDVAYDRTQDRYLVAFAEVFSATDHDIKSWHVSLAGVLLVGSSSYFDFTSANRTNPRLTCTRARRAFLASFVEGPSGLGRRIGARSRHADTGVLGTPFIVDEGSAFDRLEPDICGDAYTIASLSHFTVVWRRYWNATDSDIVARVLNEDGTFLTSEIFVTNLIGVSDEQPSISKSISPGSTDSVLVWRRAASSAGFYSIRAASISFDGAVVQPDYSLQPVSGRYSTPQVSGLAPFSFPGSTSRTFVACWDEQYPSERDISVVVASAPNLPSVTPVVAQVQNLSFMEHVSFVLDQRTPDVACTNKGFIVVQNAERPGSTQHVTRATSLGVVGMGLGISERFEPLTPTFDETLTPKTASRYEGGDMAEIRQALTVWVQQDSFGAQGDIHGAIYDMPNVTVCARQFTPCWGFPNSSSPNSRAFLWVEGTTSTIGTKRLRAIGLPIGAYGFFLTSLTATPGVTPSGSAGRLCLGGSIGRYSNSILGSGSAGSFALNISPASIAQPGGSVAAVSGQTWYFQAWHRDVASGGGPPTSNFTNAVGIPFE